MSRTENLVNRANEYYYSILPTCTEFDFTDKQRAINQHVSYMLSRTQSMFKWNGLPDTIPQRMLELYLQSNGFACFAKHTDELYVYFGGLGGEPDEYYRPTICVVSNPAQNMSQNFKINENCIVMPNDSMYMGLLPLFTRYATMIAETELSLSIASINTRVPNIVTAADDNTKDSAELFFEDIRAGKLGVCADKPFIDSLNVRPMPMNEQTIQSLIEFLQYSRASWFNDIGLNANYNMKRESLNTTESQMNNDALLPLIDDMLNQRQLFAEKVNEMFGTNISVDFASAWKDNEIEIEIEHGEIDTPQNDDTSNDDGGDGNARNETE